MKKPLLNQWQRFDARQDAFCGAYLRALLAVKHIERSVFKDFGFIALWFIRRMKIAEIRLNEQI